MLKAAFAALLAWNLAGADVAPDEPPTPLIDHAHGPVVKSGKRQKKSRVKPASMEEEPAPPAESGKSQNQPSGVSKKPRSPTVAKKPAAKLADKPAAPAKASSPPKSAAADEQPEAATDQETDADDPPPPGKLPEGVESTAIEPDAGDKSPEEEPADEMSKESLAGEEPPAAESTDPADESASEPSAAEPRPETTAPAKPTPAQPKPEKPQDSPEEVAEPKKVEPKTPPATVVPAKRPKRLQEAKPGAAVPPPATASDAIKPGPPKPATDSPPSSAQPPKKKASPPPDLDPQSARLRDRLRKALAIYYQRPVNARDHTPWEAFHWVIAYNVYAEIKAEGPWGRRTNAVGWLCYNRACHGQQLLGIDQGRIKAQYGVGLQGHEGQFLAILAQSRVMIDYPLRVGGRDFKVSDLVRTEMLGCKTGTELTFKLIALSHYLELNSQWKGIDGDTWSIPRLIREELAKPIQGAACGGTHRLMGLSYAVRMRRLRGEPIDAEYRRAEAYVKDYQRYAFGLQNSDGSFSTNWLAGREARPDTDRRLQTTGHILEWLVFSLSDQELKDPRVVKCVKYLTDILLQEPAREWKIGPLGHGLRALTLYDRRVFEPLDAPLVDDTEELVEMDAVDAATPTADKSGKQPPIRSAARPRPINPQPAADSAATKEPQAAPADESTPSADDPTADAADEDSGDAADEAGDTETEPAESNEQPDPPAEAEADTAETEAAADETEESEADAEEMADEPPAAEEGDGDEESADAEPAAPEQDQEAEESSDEPTPTTEEPEQSSAKPAAPRTGEREAAVQRAGRPRRK